MKTCCLSYQGMTLQTNGNHRKPEVRVYCWQVSVRPIYVTTSLDLAMRWVDAWQKGEVFGKVFGKRDECNDTA
jgi:hypothetical protein